MYKPENTQVLVNGIDISSDIKDIEELTRTANAEAFLSRFGGIKRAKRILKKAYTSFNTRITVVWNDKAFQCTVEELEKAISIVESTK